VQLQTQKRNIDEDGKNVAILSMFFRVNSERKRLLWSLNACNNCNTNHRTMCVHCERLKNFYVDEAAVDYSGFAAIYSQLNERCLSSVH
jgi:hypothetical protein